jgi:dephospho-CoA kinase
VSTIICLNGPPGCGKDTAARFILSSVRMSTEYKMSRPLKQGILSIFDIQNPVEMEKNKDDPQEVFGDKTFRQMQIILYNMLAEELGENILSSIACNRIPKLLSQYIIISDSGKDSEVQDLVHTFGKEKCFLLQIERPGYSFDKDIREWINTKYFISSYTAKINNKYDLELYHAQIRKVLVAWGMLKSPLKEN